MTNLTKNTIRHECPKAFSVRTCNVLGSLLIPITVCEIPRVGILGVVTHDIHVLVCDLKFWMLCLGKTFSSGMPRIVVWKTLTFWKILLTLSAMWIIWFSGLCHVDRGSKYPRNVDALLKHHTASENTYSCYYLGNKWRPQLKIPDFEGNVKFLLLWQRT